MTMFGVIISTLTNVYVLAKFIWIMSIWVRFMNSFYYLDFQIRARITI